MVLRSRKPRVVAALLALGGLAGCERATPPVAPPPPAKVIVAKPVLDYVTDYEDFTGRTDAIFSVEIRARVSGYLDNVNFKDGEEVKKGDTLFTIDPRPYKAELDRVEAVLAQGEAHLKRLEADYKRATNLYNRGQISREEYDRFVGDRSEAEAAVGIAKAQYDLAKLNVEYTKTTSPIEGRLSRRLVDPGNMVQADTTALTTVVSQDPLYVYWDVDERTLLRLRRLIGEGRVKNRSEADVEVLVGLSDEEGFPHKGLINFSDNKVDPGTGTLRVRASIPNPKPYLLSPGLFARVRLPVGDARKSLMISAAAVGTDQGRKFLYVVNDKNVVEYRLVTIGKMDNGMQVIEDGLKAGELVVVNGLQRIRPGAKVDPTTQPDKSPRGTAAAPALPKAPAALAKSGG